MTIKKEDCEKVILTTGEMSLLKRTDDATAYRVGNEYYDFEFTNEENPFGAKFVISERAWVIKKPRTKTEFVKSSMNLFEIIDFLESGKKLYTNDVGSAHICQSIYKEWKLKDLLNRDFYIEVETEIDERQEFIGEAVELLNQNSHDNEANHYKEWFGAMFDSGKFKLVEGK